MVRTNDRMRAKMAKLVLPDTRIESVLALKGVKGPNTGDRGTTVARYINRYGLTNTLGSTRLLDDQWLVLTENRFLFFAKKGSGLLTRIGPLDHALDRTQVALQWADFTEATVRKRLIHLTTTDQRMNISHTVIGGLAEADLLVQAAGDRGTEIGLQEL